MKGRVTSSNTEDIGPKIVTKQTRLDEIMAYGNIYEQSLLPCVSVLIIFVDMKRRQLRDSVDPVVLHN